MNARTSVTVSAAAEAMIRYKTAAGKSKHTIRNYRVSLAKLLLYLEGDPPLATISRDEIVGFFVWLQEEYISEPDGAAPRGRIRLSQKSILNIHTDLSALWAWAVEQDLVPSNIVRTVVIDRPKEPAIEPFGKADIEALLRACTSGRTWKARQAGPIHPNADREAAIVMLLLDTGMRASELCNARLDDLNITANSIRVVGKGDKERFVYFGRRTSKALWKYLTPRLSLHCPEGDYLFLVDLDGRPRPMSRYILARILSRLGERARVPHVYPHRFRHTFAISYLRNGGDVLTLQALLGHSDLAMVRRYARIAQTDCANAHLKASPVENWKL